MGVCDQLSLSYLTAGPDSGTGSPPGLGAPPERPESPERPEPVELAEVDRLILDLAALVEAGLVAVHDPVFGPARYGVVSARDEVRLRVT